MNIDGLGKSRGRRLGRGHQRDKWSGLLCYRAVEFPEKCSVEAKERTRGGNSTIWTNVGLFWSHCGGLPLLRPQLSKPMGCREWLEKNSRRILHAPLKNLTGVFTPQQRWLFLDCSKEPWVSLTTAWGPQIGYGSGAFQKRASHCY